MRWKRMMLVKESCSFIFDFEFGNLFFTAAGLISPKNEVEVGWERMHSLIFWIFLELLSLFDDLGSLSHTQSLSELHINDPSSDDEPFAVQMSTIDEDQSLILTSAQPTPSSAGPFLAFPEETTLDLSSKIICASIVESTIVFVQIQKNFFRNISSRRMMEKIGKREASIMDM